MIFINSRSQVFHTRSKAYTTYSTIPLLGKCKLGDGPFKDIFTEEKEVSKVLNSVTREQLPGRGQPEAVQLLAG
jgi:hypothetical protein